MELNRGWKSWLAFIAGFRRETGVRSPYTKFGRDLVINDLQVEILSTKKDRQTGEQAENYRAPSIIVGGGGSCKKNIAHVVINQKTMSKT